MEPKPFVNKRNQNNYSEGLHQEHSADNDNLGRRKSLDLDDLFQFNAAKQRAAERNAHRDIQQPFANYVPHRVFINHIDSYHGKHLADYLADQIMGASKAEIPDGLPEEEPEDVKEYFSDQEIEDIEKEKEKKPGQHNYEIFGTTDFVHYPEYRRTEDIADILDAEKKQDFLGKILSCGFIIYDITTTLHCHPLQIQEAAMVLETIVKQLSEMEKSSPKAFKKYKDCRIFILISTLMTWAKTKPIDPEDPGLAFTEGDYRKRKPHPNYKVHCEFEKRVIEFGKKYPKNLRTIVVGTGVTYGQNEDILHFLFKMAWMSAPELPLFSPGKNLVPLIHVDSLCSIIHLLLEEFPKGIRYIVAVEQSSTSLKKIVQLISKGLGNGKVVKISKEEAFLYPDVKQRNYDMLTVHLNMEPRYIVDGMDVKWSSELPFGENIQKIMAEFQKSRNLSPVRIFVHGPPATGKSFMAKRLSKYYDIHYLNVKEVIEQGIQKIKDRIQEKKSKEAAVEDKEKEKLNIEGDEEDEEEEEELEDEDEEEEDVGALSELLNEIEENMSSNERNRLDESFVIRFFKEKMTSNACLNQGFVIDGYPKTMEVTRILYEPGDEAEEAVVEEESSQQQGTEALCNTKIMPGYVVSFDASDEFLIDRVISIPEIYVQNTHYEEEEMCRRLDEFRAANTEDNTPLIFYDELEVHPMIYNVEEDTDPEMEPTFQSIVKQIGAPRNYGPCPAELDKMWEHEKELKKQKQLEELKAREEEIRKKAQDRREKIEFWMFQKDQEKEMEEKALALLAMPLRHYLMKYIFPTLTRGLVEVARVRPDDPVDFLAEFLFRDNPEGKMFQPNYDEEGEELVRAMEELKGSDMRKTYKGSDQDSTSFFDEDSIVADAVSNVSEIHAKCSHPSLVIAPKIPPEHPKKESPKEESTEVCRCMQVPSPCESGSSSSSSSVYTPPPGSSCTCPPTCTHCRCPL